MNTLPPMGMEFWERLSAFVNNNPVQDRDLFYMGMLKPLGIEKGKPFKPDARQRAILEEAARIGDAMGRVMLFHGPERFRQPEPFPGTKWHWLFQVNPVQQTATYGQVDERLHYTYSAIYTTPALGIMKAGPGGNYVQAFYDKDGQHFDGGKSYRLHVPANVPAAAFWSLTLYDTAHPLHDPEPEQRLCPLVTRHTQGERRRFGRPLLRPQTACGNGEQLDRDDSRQGLLADVPFLHTQRGIVRRHMEAAGCRVDEIALTGDREDGYDAPTPPPSRPESPRPTVWNRAWARSISRTACRMR